MAQIWALFAAFSTLLSSLPCLVSSWHFPALWKIMWEKISQIASQIQPCCPYKLACIPFHPIILMAESHGLREHISLSYIRQIQNEEGVKVQEEEMLLGKLRLPKVLGLATTRWLKLSIWKVNIWREGREHFFLREERENSHFNKASKWSHLPWYYAKESY